MNPVIVRNVAIGEGIPKICVPIVGKTKEEILQAAEEILEVPADLVEWRVDWYESVFEMQKVVAVSKELRKILGNIPILFTFRTKAEGGEREINSRVYSMLYKMMLATGNIDLIDVEIFTFKEELVPLIETAHKCGVKVVGSSHDFVKTPTKEEIIERLCYIQNTGVDISKLAVMPQTKKDVLNLLEATEKMTSEYADRPVITMSMAGMGTISRLSCEMFGSAVTFGAVRQVSAPGQVNVNELKRILEILHNANTQ